MTADKVRMSAYSSAMRRFIGPESVVLDIGAGTGVMSILACQFGARKVYAVEPSDAIALARQIAEANGFGKRIEFIQALSTAVDLPEQADVIVSDLRGVLPLYEQHIASIADARARLLAPGGTLIPSQDTLWAAVVESAATYDRLVAPWDGNGLGIDMEPGREMVTNSWRKLVVAADNLLCEPQCWGVIDYATAVSPNVTGSVEFKTERAGVGHGLLLWFDACLADGIQFSNAPGQPELIYGSGFFPWSRPVALEIGDTVSVRIRADLPGNDYVWSWASRVYRDSPNSPKAHFAQSTFFGTPFSGEKLHQRAGGFRPSLGENGQIDRLILERMDGASSLAEIARVLTAQFPRRFSSSGAALERVADLSNRYSVSPKQG